MPLILPSKSGFILTFYLNLSSFSCIDLLLWVDFVIGLISVKLICQAHILKTFIDLAVNPLNIHSQYLSALYDVKILGEKINNITPPPPYYDEPFFDLIKLATDSGKDV